EATRQFETVLELYAAQPEGVTSLRSADIRLRLGDVLVQSTRIDDGLENLRLALATYERLRHAEGQARAHRQIASAYQGRYRDFGLALPHLEAALQMWPTEREDAEYV